MKREILHFFVFVFTIKMGFTQDTIKVYFFNPYYRDPLEIYMFKSRDSKFLITKVNAEFSERKIYFPGIRIHAQGNPLFWIYRKKRFWINGKWIPIYSGFETGKVLLIRYSKERKKKYCYEYLWVNGNELKINFK
jgi:hypothetical protein